MCVEEGEYSSSKGIREIYKMIITRDSPQFKEMNASPDTGGM